MEVWKKIRKYEDLYEISNLGRIKSVRINKILKLNKDRKGYYIVDLYKNEIRKTKRVNVLVAQEFIANPYKLPIVNHIDGNKLNNRIDNLEWCTYSENLKHAYRNNLRRPKENKVNQYDIKNNFIKEYYSISEASRRTGIYRTSISKCCKGKLKTAGGYIWKKGSDFICQKQF